jgi:death-on-curing protein
MVEVLSLESVIKIHDYQVTKYGGKAEIRDRNLLESAINQPLLEYHFLCADVYQMAASYCYHISQNHPFMDGNKRTAFAAMVAFLRINGIKVIADEEEIINMLLDISAHKKDKQDLENWIRKVTIHV